MSWKRASNVDFFSGTHIAYSRASHCPLYIWKVYCALVFLGAYLVGVIKRLDGSLQPKIDHLFGDGDH